MDQELDMERRQAQSDQISGSQGQGLGKSTDCILSVAGKYVCLWCLPPGEGRGAPAEKWPYLSWAGLLFSGTHSCGLVFFFFFLVKKFSCFWPFKMGRIVQSIFISLWCVCFASAEARCHICHVCSGFHSLLLITLYRLHGEPGSVSVNWQAHVLFSSPKCIGLLFFWQSSLCTVCRWLLFPNMFWWPTHF